MSASKKHEHNHAEAHGGFWIKPDGSTVPVLNECGHYDTINGLGFPGYNPAYHKGWARITFCRAGYFGGTFFANEVALPALRTMVEMLRHYAPHRAEVMVETTDDYDDPIRGAWPYTEAGEAAYRAKYPEHRWGEHGEGAGTRVASQVAAFMLERAKAAREPVEPFSLAA
jgi:hypothetical protein